MPSQFAPYSQNPDNAAMESIINLHVEQLPEGLFLATSDDVPGLVAQGRTLQETLEIARDVARQLAQARSERGQALVFQPLAASFDHPLVLSA